MEKILFSPELVRQSGRSGYRFAKDIGVAYTTYYNLIHGRTVPLLSVARRAADLIGVPLERLEFLAERPSASLESQTV